MSPDTFDAVPTRVFSGPVRFLIYLVGIPAFALSAGWFTASLEECPPEASDCDLAGLAIVGVTFLAAVLGVAIAILVEVVLAVRRRRTS